MYMVYILVVIVNFCGIRKQPQGISCGPPVEYTSVVYHLYYN